MTHEQAAELIQLGKAIVGALGNIGDQIEKLAEKKAPPSSKRGGK